MQTHEGKHVIVVRDANQNDPGYDVAASKQKPAVDAIDQLLVRYDDGTTEVVFRDKLEKVEDAPKPAVKVAAAPVVKPAPAAAAKT